MSANLRVEYDYLVADANEWLADIASENLELTEELRATLAQIEQDNRANYDRDYSYASTENIVAALTRMGYRDFRGIYGEDGPVSVAMCNEDTLLDNDLSFVFVHATKPAEEDSPNMDEGRTFVIVNGTGYHLHSNSFVDVYDFNGYDDADAFSYSRGFAGHVDVAAGDACGADWILDDPGTLWRNGGMGDTVKVHDAIVDGKLICPDCGAELAGMTS